MYERENGERFIWGFLFKGGMRICLIVNRKAGERLVSFRTFKGMSDPIESIREVIISHGHEVDKKMTKSRGDAEKFALQAAKEGYDVVVAMGGDGTINDVVNGLIKSGKTDKVKLGIIPAGTANVLAKDLKIPLHPLKAAKVLCTGKSHKVDAGKVNEKYFLCWSGIGLDSHLINQVSPRLKKMVGSVAYTYTTLKKLGEYDFPRIRVTKEKEAFEGYFVIVSKIKYYGGTAITIAPFAEKSDGHLDVIVFNSRKVLDYAAFSLMSLIGYHATFKNVKYFKAKKIKVTSEKPVLMHVDAEIMGTTPATIEAVPNALEIIMTK